MVQLNQSTFHFRFFTPDKKNRLRFHQLYSHCAFNSSLIFSFDQLNVNTSTYDSIKTLIIDTYKLLSCMQFYKTFPAFRYIKL